VPDSGSSGDVETTADYTVRRFDDTGELPAQRDRPGQGWVLDEDGLVETPSDRPAWLTELVNDDEPPYDPYWGKPPRRPRSSSDSYRGRSRATPEPAEDPYWGRPALPAGPSSSSSTSYRSPKPPPKPPVQRPRREPQPEPPPEAPTTAPLPQSVPPSGPSYGAYRRNRSGQDWRAPAPDDDWRGSTSDRWSAVARRTQAAARPTQAIERRTQAIERRPTRPARGDYFSGGSDLYTSSWQNDDEDGDGDVYDLPDANSYLAAALSTIAWFVVPALTFLGWVLFLDAGPRNEALRNLTTGGPWILITVAASIGLALVLRRLATGWRALTVGFAAAVVGAGVATVLFTVVSQ
jgi:hypothetical protein